MADNFVTLENWSLGLDFRLGGRAYGHHRIEDGHRVITTPIKKVNVEQGLIQTESGTIYRLGEVDQQYEAIYPNAKERFWDSAKKFNSV